MPKTAPFSRQSVLVTGASGGIGFQIARDFLSQGARVGARFHQDESRARQLMKYGARGRCRLLRADFSETVQVFRLYEEFLRWTGGTIDVLVNNAGQVQMMGLHDLTEDAWDRAFQVNVKAPFFLGRAALRTMSGARRGRIINIGSIGVKFGGGKETVHYSASKAALEAVTRSFAKAGAPHNVLVNTVRAGVTETPLLRKTKGADMADRIALVPLKRAASAEISNVVLFIASQQSSFVTNTTIDVAGGE